MGNFQLKAKRDKAKYYNEESVGMYLRVYMKNIIFCIGTVVL